VIFRPDLIEPRLDALSDLLQRLASIQLSPGSDVFRWNLHVNGSFSVDSLYNMILQTDLPVDNNNKIWKMEILLKTKIFAWYLHRGVILTKDNLAKRNCYESSRCIFCHRDKIIKHLFFSATLTDLYSQSSK
jgi:hypothetical protein